VKSLGLWTGFTILTRALWLPEHRSKRDMKMSSQHGEADEVSSHDIQIDERSMWHCRFSRPISPREDDVHYGERFLFHGRCCAVAWRAESNSCMKNDASQLYEKLTARLPSTATKEETNLFGWKVPPNVGGQRSYFGAFALILLPMKSGWSDAKGKFILEEGDKRSDVHMYAADGQVLSQAMSWLGPLRYSSDEKSGSVMDEWYEKHVKQMVSPTRGMTIEMLVEFMQNVLWTSYGGDMVETFGKRIELRAP
jgi:hypothetical protein